MKREQIEKIARAAAALREAVGPTLAYFSVTDTIREGGTKPRINFELRDDDSFHATAALFGAEAHRTVPSTSCWWWYAHAAIDGLDIYFQGPSHRKEPAVANDDAKVDAAIAQATEAATPEQTSLLCYFDTPDGPCIEANGHTGYHRSSATTDDPIEKQMRAAVVFDSRGAIVKDRRGALPTRGDS